MEKEEIIVENRVYINNVFWSDDVALKGEESDYIKIEGDIILSKINFNEYKNILDNLKVGDFEESRFPSLQSYGVMIFKYKTLKEDLQKGRFASQKCVALDVIGFLQIISRKTLNICFHTIKTESETKIIPSSGKAYSGRFYHRDFTFNRNNIFPEDKIKLFWSRYKRLDREKITFRKFKIFQSDSLYDRLMTLVVAFESLFNDSGESIKYKVALRTAFFVGVDLKERKNIFNYVKKAYDYRSHIIHGGNLGFVNEKNAKKVMKFCGDQKTMNFLEETLRRALIFALEKDKFPEVKEVDEAIINGNIMTPFDEKLMSYLFPKLS